MAERFNLWLQGNGKDVVMKLSWDLGTGKGANLAGHCPRGWSQAEVRQLQQSSKQTLVTILNFFRKLFWAPFFRLKPPVGSGSLHTKKNFL